MRRELKRRTVGAHGPLTESANSTLIHRVKHDETRDHSLRKSTERVSRERAEERVSFTAIRVTTFDLMTELTFEL